MNIKQEFIKQFCNDHNGYVRWLRGVAFTKKDFLEDILNFCNRQDKQINKDKIRMLKSICKNDCTDRSYSNCGLKRGISGKCHVSDLIKRITEGK